MERKLTSAVSFVNYGVQSVLASSNPNWLQNTIITKLRHRNNIFHVTNCFSRKKALYGRIVTKQVVGKDNFIKCISRQLPRSLRSLADLLPQANVWYICTRCMSFFIRTPRKIPMFLFDDDLIYLSSKIMYVIVIIAMTSIADIGNALTFF